jgi:hypothetical protein
MTEQCSLRCRCGAVRGVATQLSAKTGSRVICYCDDCQAFAHFLKRPDVLDAAGGTDLFQMAIGRVTITQGQDALRSMRLSPSGMLRFYTACCSTPIGNTMNGHVPFVGLVLEFADLAADGKTRDGVFGPALGIMAKFARGPVPKDAVVKVPVGLLVRSVGLLLGWKFSGLGGPSPFFDAKHQPRVQPDVLSEAERSALQPRTVTSSVGTS